MYAHTVAVIRLHLSKKKPIHCLNISAGVASYKQVTKIMQLLIFNIYWMIISFYYIYVCLLIFLKKKLFYSHYYSPRTKTNKFTEGMGAVACKLQHGWSWSTMIVSRCCSRQKMDPRRFTIAAFSINKHWPNPGLKKRILFQYVFFTIMNKMPSCFILKKRTVDTTTLN